jgi:hypothetical protein
LNVQAAPGGSVVIVTVWLELVVRVAQPPSSDNAASAKMVLRRDDVISSPFDDST